jgi:hypothetical protein
MEQRPLRLGDIVDDYCPRERRLTNHAIVAVVDDTIKQTRCTTCDAEHVYKNGREPRIRKRAGESLYDQVLGDLTGGQLKTKPAESPVESPAIAASGQQAPGPKPPSPQGSMASPQGSTDQPSASPEQTDAEKSDADARADAWLAHRRLIRAALPKTEGELPPPRPIPEFTMHQRPQGRGGRPFRFGGGGGGGFNPGGGGERNGNVAHGPGGHRHGGPHQNGSGGSNRGSWQGGGEGQGQGRPPGGGRRRGRRKRAGGGGGRGPTN